MSTRGWIMGIIIMIISEALDIVWWGWMIEKKATLMKIVAYYRDVTLGCVDQHL
jgi:hypothetical protein